MSDHDFDRPIGRSNNSVQKQQKPTPWLWQGVLAAGAVTLLSADEKTGKTTLMSLLLDRRRAGGQLLGRAVRPGRTVLCSEENEKLWALRQPPLDFGPDLRFHHPSCESPTRGYWKRYIEDLCALDMQGNTFDLLVIDTAVAFLPLPQRNRRALRWTLSQLGLVASFPAA